MMFRQLSILVMALLGGTLLGLAVGLAACRAEMNRQQREIKSQEREVQWMRNRYEGY